MAILITRTKAGSAARAAATLKAARRMPHLRSRQHTVEIPVPDLHLTTGPRVELSVPRLGMPHPRRRRQERAAVASLITSAARAADARTRPERPHRMRRAAGVAAAAGGTAIAVYLLDPERGKRRRSEARERGARLLRDASRAGTQEARHVVDMARAKVSSVKPSRPADLNDPALARKVESEIFRAADAPKGDVDVNVEHGIVYLRGQVRDQATIERLTADAEAVEGVERVESLLHLPGQEAPPKVETLDSSALLDREGAAERTRAEPGAGPSAA